MNNIIEKLALFGYGVYTIPTGLAVADPLDNVDGFYLEVGTVEQLAKECEYILQQQPWSAKIVPTPEHVKKDIREDY